MILLMKILLHNEYKIINLWYPTYVYQFFNFPYNYKSRVLACFQTRPPSRQSYSVRHVALAAAPFGRPYLQGILPVPQNQPAGPSAGLRDVVPCPGHVLHPQRGAVHSPDHVLGGDGHIGVPHCVVGGRVSGRNSLGSIAFQAFVGAVRRLD